MGEFEINALAEDVAEMAARTERALNALDLAAREDNTPEIEVRWLVIALSQALLALDMAHVYLPEPVRERIAGPARDRLRQVASDFRVGERAEDWWLR